MKSIQFLYDHAGVDVDTIKKYADTIKDYVVYLNSIIEQKEYDGKETSINACADEGLYTEMVEAVQSKKTPDLKCIVIIGIGGSNLGPYAIYEAIQEHPVTTLFADTVSPSMHIKIKNILEKNVKKSSEILISLVSKSGTTTETAGNFEYIYAYLKEKFPDIDGRIVVTTEKGSKLWVATEENKHLVLEHRNIGGRFSIMATVGQFPLLMAGFDVKALLQGACDIRQKCLSTSFDENIALKSASILFHHNTKGVPIFDTFFFNPELESLGKWYRQLMGESLGKDGKGIVPTVSIGSTDLHSMVQLYLGGPKNRLTNFVYSPQQSLNVTLPQPLHFQGLVDVLEGKNLADVMDAIYQGVKTAYQKKGLPFMEVRFPEISEYTLGQYMQFKMIETMYLGKLMGVNTFDQPNVEDYKVETKAILK